MSLCGLAGPGTRSDRRAKEVGRDGEGLTSPANSTPGRAAAKCCEDLVQGVGEGGEVAVVEASGVDLHGKLEEGWRPRCADRRCGLVDVFDDTDFLLDFDDTVDDLDGGDAGRRGASLLPGSTAAGLGAPLRDPACGSDVDRLAAPPHGTVWPTGRRGGFGRPMETPLVSLLIGTRVS